MWLYIHRPFEVWPWLAELRIERVYMIVVLVFWAIQPKVWQPSRSHWPVFLLAVAYLLGITFSPFATHEAVENWFKVLVFYALFMTTVTSEKQLRTIVIAYVCAVALYELHSLREYSCGRGVYRMGTWRMIGVDETVSDPNSFGASINYALPFLYPVWTLAKRRWMRLVVLLMALLGVSCIVLTGSRSSFAAVGLLLVIAALASRYRWRFICVLFLVAPLVWNNMRGDLQARYMTLIDPSRGPENARQSAEGRTQSFWYGMKSFAENPIFGAGLGSYRAATGYGTHNLYNQAIGELGILGLAVLVGFAWTFVANYREAHLLVRQATDTECMFLHRVCVAALLSCILLFVLGWGSHNLPRYNWLWFGAFSGIAVQLLRQHYSNVPSNDVLTSEMTMVNLSNITNDFISVKKAKSVS